MAIRTNHTGLKISKAAADVLTTECAHVWRHNDTTGEGLGSWIAKELKDRDYPLERGRRTVEISGGVSLTVFTSPWGWEIEHAVYTPKHGTRTKRVVSFGRTGVSYFVNLETNGAVSVYSLTRVLFPSRDEKRVDILPAQAAELKAMAGKKQQGIAACERILKTA